MHRIPQRASSSLPVNLDFLRQEKSLQTTKRAPIDAPSPCPALPWPALPLPLVCPPLSFSFLLLAPSFLTSATERKGEGAGERRRGEGRGKRSLRLSFPPSWDILSFLSPAPCPSFPCAGRPKWGNTNNQLEEEFFWQRCCSLACCFFFLCWRP